MSSCSVLGLRVLNEDSFKDHVVCALTNRTIYLCLIVGTIELICSVLMAVSSSILQQVGFILIKLYFLAAVNVIRRGEACSLSEKDVSFKLIYTISSFVDAHFSSCISASMGSRTDTMRKHSIDCFQVLTLFVPIYTLLSFVFLGVCVLFEIFIQPQQISTIFTFPGI